MKLKKLRKTNPHKNIMFFESSKNYTLIYFHDGKVVVSSFNLKKFEEDEQFSDFIRVSREHLINPFFIQKIIKNNDQIFVCMKSGQEFKISRRRLHLFNHPENGFIYSSLLLDNWILSVNIS